MKKALITGITGQDGSYLAELLLEKGYEVHGLVRRISTGPNTYNIENIKNKVYLHTADLTDCSSLRHTVMNIAPDEVYNLGAQTHVSIGFKLPEYTLQVNGHGVLNLLEAVRELNNTKECKFYQASTSELYGKVQEIPQTEKTPFYPRSPYAVAKLYAYWITVNYRESYGLYTCNGILFNHESPRRGIDFVTRKIVNGMIRVHLNRQEVLELGNLDALRDWGHAKDYVNAMWLMLQQPKPDDYVISSGQQYSVKYFCESVASYLGFELLWQGKEMDEVGINKNTGKVVIRINKELYRPAEVNTLLGDSTKARKQLNWLPEYSFEDLVTEMCEEEMKIQTSIFEEGN